MTQRVSQNIGKAGESRVCEWPGRHVSRGSLSSRIASIRAWPSASSAIASRFAVIAALFSRISSRSSVLTDPISAHKTPDTARPSASSPPNSHISERRKPPFWLESKSRQGSTDQACEPGKDQEPDDSAADNLDPLQLRPQLSPERIDLAFELRLGRLKFLLDKFDVSLDQFHIGLCRDAAGDSGMDRESDRLGLGMFDARVPKALDFGERVERGLCHAASPADAFVATWRRIAGVCGRFQPFLRRRARLPKALAAGLFLALPAPTLAQSGVPDGEADGQGDLRAALGNCPREDLLKAWEEMDALSAAAVELEVVVMCRERAEAIASFIDAEARLRGALALLRAPGQAPVPVPVPAVTDDRVEHLQEEIASLRGRIARLEGEPELPETDSALVKLRDDLALAEAELARIEEAGIAVATTPADVLPPVADGTAGESVPSMAAGAPAEPVLSEVAEEVAGLVTDLTLATPVKRPAEADAPLDSLPPPGAAPAEAEVAALPPVGSGEGAQSSLPVPLRTETSVQVRNSAWRVIHAVRSDGRQWEVRLQATREEGVIEPAPVPEGGDAVALPSLVRWFPVLDSPVTRAVGEVLPDGLTVLAVTPDGVELGDPGAPDTAPTLVPFATGNESVPGVSDWIVVREEEGG